MRLAGAGRALDHDRETRLRADHRDGLGAIGIVDFATLSDGAVVVDEGVVVDIRRGGGVASAQHGGGVFVHPWLAFFGPDLTAQVHVHGVLLVVEEAQADLVVVNLPSLAPTDGGFDLLEVVKDGFLVVVLRQLQVELQHLGAEGEVLADVAAIVANLQAAVSLAFQADRDVEKGRAEGSFAALVPFKCAEGEEEGVDAEFFIGEGGLSLERTEFELEDRFVLFGREFGVHLVDGAGGVGDEGVHLFFGGLAELRHRHIVFQSRNGAIVSSARLGRVWLAGERHLFALFHQHAMNFEGAFTHHGNAQAFGRAVVEHPVPKGEIEELLAKRFNLRAHGFRGRRRGGHEGNCTGERGAQQERWAFGGDSVNYAMNTRAFNRW